jgi:nitroreductase
MQELDSTNLFKVMQERRSIRKFKQEPLRDNDLRKILEAGAQRRLEATFNRGTSQLSGTKKPKQHWRQQLTIKRS